VTGEFQAYLAAKRSVDDRALDRRTLERLRTALAAPADRPLRVLEAGAGVGTMVERLLEWDTLPPGDVEYVAVDIDPDSVAAARERLAGWAEDRGLAVERGGDPPAWAPVTAAPLSLVGPDRTVTVVPATGDAAEVAGAAEGADLVVGMALLDVLERAALPAMLSAAAPGGLAYFPITFDGGTRFVPDHPLDGAVERAYHAHMDAKDDARSRAGEAALATLERLDATTVLAVGGSDWVVRPGPDGYPGEEAAFLHHILDTVEGAVAETLAGDERGWATTADPALDRDALADWADRRRRQVDDGALTYLTHQLDLLARVAGTPAQSAGPQLE
jgi:SAM-dependent methyltransferase